MPLAVTLWLSLTDNTAVVYWNILQCNLISSEKVGFSVDWCPMFKHFGSPCIYLCESLKSYIGCCGFTHTIMRNHSFHGNYKLCYTSRGFPSQHGFVNRTLKGVDEFNRDSFKPLRNHGNQWVEILYLITFNRRPEAGTCMYVCNTHSPQKYCHPNAATLLWNFTRNLQFTVSGEGILYTWLTVSCSYMGYVLINKLYEMIS